MIWSSNKSQTDHQRGQSMLEAIVAAGVIVTAVSAALTLVQSSLTAAKSSEEQIVAHALAQEGIEVVRHLRDSNWLAGRPYDQDIVGPANYELISVPIFNPDTKTWSLDFSGVDWEGNKVRIYKQVTTDGSAPAGLYRQAASQPDGTEVTRFRRRLDLLKLCSQVGEPVDYMDNAIDYDRLSASAPCPLGQDNIGFEVKSEVRWDRPGGGEQAVSIIERMFDWR